jgi:hypothetical protein
MVDHEERGDIEFLRQMVAGVGGKQTRRLDGILLERRFIHRSGTQGRVEGTRPDLSLLQEAARRKPELEMGAGRSVSNGHWLRRKMEGHNSYWIRTDNGVRDGHRRNRTRKNNEERSLFRSFEYPRSIEEAEINGVTGKQFVVGDFAALPVAQHPLFRASGLTCVKLVRPDHPELTVDSRMSSWLSRIWRLRKC